ncbi:MAG: CHAT domain-containing protein [Myxococcales bacterium]|nr:CHAT domain-containing protein [Myxococcales bacterium]
MDEECERDELIDVLTRTLGASRARALLERAPEPIAARPRLLFLAANPGETGRLDLEREHREIEAALRRGERGPPLSLRAAWAVRISDLQDALLRHQPTIVHFSGHGVSGRAASGDSRRGRDLSAPVTSPGGPRGRAGLVLRGAADERVTLSPEALAELLDEFSGDLRCVVLNACHSREQAETLARRVDVVIGMDADVEDGVAIAFARGFYGALAHDAALARAFNLGCNAIALAGFDQASAPRLIVRGPEVDPATMRLTASQRTDDVAVRRALESLGEEGRALLERLRARASTEPRERPRGPVVLHVHALQRARHFTGRAALLSSLTTWARAPRPRDRVLAVVGVGGAGKTAVVERLLDALEQEQAPATGCPGGVLVWSFFEDPRIEAFLARAVAHFAGSRSSRPEPGELLECLENALRVGRADLLILDGVEFVQSEGRADRAFGEIEEPLLRRLLWSLARGLGTARALVTSRFPLADLADWEGEGLRTIELAPLSPAEGAALLRRWGASGSTAQLRDISAHAAGHPLTIAMTGSYASAFLDGDAGAVARQTSGARPSPSDDVLARRLSELLAAYVSVLGPVERDLLTRVSVFPRGVELELLVDLANANGRAAGALAGAERRELQRALGKLTRLGILYEGTATRAGATRYAAHPIVRDHFAPLLGRDADELHMRVIERLMHGVAERGALTGKPMRNPAAQDPTLRDAFEDLIVHSLRSGDPRAAYEVYKRVLGGFRVLGMRLGEMARGLRILRAFAGGAEAEALPRALDPRARARLAHDWALYAAALGDFAQAARCYAFELEQCEGLSVGGAKLSVGALQALGRTHRILGEPRRALAFAREAVARARSSGDTSALALSRALEGVVLRDLGELDEAARCFADSPDRDGKLAGALWYAEHLAATGEVDRARELVRARLRLSRELGWANHAASCESVLADMLLSPGTMDARSVDEAARHLDALRRWTRRSGEVRLLAREHELMARVELARDRLEAARVSVDAGVALTTACGMRARRRVLLNLNAAVALEESRASTEESARLDAAIRETLAAVTEDDPWHAAEAYGLAGVAAVQAGAFALARERISRAMTLGAPLDHPALEVILRARSWLGHHLP